MNLSIKYQISSVLLALVWGMRADAADSELHGFVETRAGMRLQNDRFEEDRSLTELRAQVDSLTYLQKGQLQIRADFLYDDLADQSIDLETGEGFIDLREFNYLFTPADWADVKIGRQILTWGTGDLLFINDLFPKDWNSFLLGRDEEYLKAPSDAIFASFFPSIGTLDVAYMPRMDADRYVDGSRVSYWNPATQSLAGQNAVTAAEQRDAWFQDQEIAARFYRPVKSYEGALYLYHGFWKSPSGSDALTGNAYFPELNVYGASLKGTLGNGLVNAEVGYYDSCEDRSGSDPLIPNSETRFLVGYEREAAKNLTVGLQYYVEWMKEYDRYLAGVSAHTARDETRHIVTLRLTKRMMNQNLILGLFTFYSPSDQDAYFRPNVTYKLTDSWMLTASGNLFTGKNDHTFFGQFEQNSNLAVAARYSF